MCVQPQTTTAVSRSLWLFDPRAADIQAIEGMKSSIFWVLARWGVYEWQKKKVEKEKEKYKK